MKDILHFVCASLFLSKVSEGWKEALPPFESMMATVGRMDSCFSTCARGKETPELFLVRAFLLWSRLTSTCDVSL